MTKQKRKRKSKVQTERTFEQIALAEFLDTGEVTGLLALADCLDERDEQPEFAGKLREVAGKAAQDSGERFLDAVRFFMPQYSGVPVERAQFDGGLLLAEAESWFQRLESDREFYPENGKLQFLWEQEDYEDGGPPIAWNCVLLRAVSSDWWRDRWCRITFSGDGELDGTQADSDYRRVVEAKLAAELKARTK